jgi:large subunit ribosomal protein L29
MRERELGIGLPPAKQAAAAPEVTDAKADKKAKKADKADKAEKKSKKKTEDES